MKNKHQSPNCANEAGLIFQGSTSSKNGLFIHKTSQASQASQVSQISQAMQANQIRSRHLGALSYGGLFGVVVSVLTLGMTIASSSVYATDSAIDQIKVSVPIFCSLSSTGTNSHSAEVNSGTYIDDIGTTTIKALCNDNEGFSIYATGYTGNEIGGENSNKLVSGTNTIVTGTATGPVGSTDTSNWAMKLSTTTSPTPTYPLTIESDTEGSFTSYHSVPNTYTKVATRSSGTDVGDEAVGSTFSTTYATYISGVQAPGTYVGQVKYTLVHPASEVPLQPQTAQSGCINYFPNGGNVEGTMGCQSITTSATSATLLASNFSRTGYGFAGWSDKYDYTTNPNANFYGPNEDITFTAGQYTGTNNGLSLYAVWVKSEGSIQDTTKVAEVCTRLTQSGPAVTKTLSSVSALTDQRDNETYAIAKLADGKCWMIENLRLENTGTDNTNGSLAQGYNSSFIGLADPEEPSLFTSTATANSLYSTDGSTDATISGSNPGYRFPRYNHTNTDTRATSPTTGTNQNIYSYGNYYTWPAAIADTTNYTTNNQSIENTSLCPTGWHLPKGGNNQNTANNEFLAFSEATIGAKPANYDSQTYPSYTGTPEGTDASNSLRAYPNNFVYSGYVDSGSVNNRGSYGGYWSSTASSSINAYGMFLYSNYVSPGTNNVNKYGGWSIRCLAPGA